MPELPEVETTRRGIAPHLVGRRIDQLTIHRSDLRWPVPEDLSTSIVGDKLRALERRAKYLLFHFGRGTMLVHLGMSGSLRIDRAESELRTHDHVEWRIGRHMLRYHDPRRFGSVLWANPPAERHHLLRDLGPEPLLDAFDGDHLKHLAHRRRVAVKNFIMDHHVVVGVGNIYASEALFYAGIDPRRTADRVSLTRYRRLASEIKRVLSAAITQGGTTLRDFVSAEGTPGYFSQSLAVYDREEEPCRVCQTPIRRLVIGQRASYFCTSCQR